MISVTIMWNKIYHYG